MIRVLLIYDSCPVIVDTMKLFLSLYRPSKLRHISKDTSIVALVLKDHAKSNMPMHYLLILFTVSDASRLIWSKRFLLKIKLK